METFSKSKKSSSLSFEMLDCNLTSKTIPVIYREENNITFYGIEKLHPFDPAKYRRIFRLLIENGLIVDESQVMKQKPCTIEQLKTVHTENYLKSLTSSITVATIAEFPLFACIPNFLLQWYFIAPMHYQVGATILGGEVALKYGWCICLSGGMHHASSASGGGWCVFSDIPISIKNLRTKGLIKKSMIIDLDVHQGNGHERDKIAGFMGVLSEKDGSIKTVNSDCYILDMFNRDRYPGDKFARSGIDKIVTFPDGFQTKKYISKLKKALKEAFEEFRPDIIFYNAGTDILEGDPLGGIQITEEGVIERDELVFTEAIIVHKIPIVMVLSGGYQQSNAAVISQSILNLEKKLKLTQIAFKNASCYY